MAFVVTDNCIQCKYTDCVAVCPADAFHEGPNFMVINPIECIDCGLCVPECDAQAIFQEDELEDDQKDLCGTQRRACGNLAKSDRSETRHG